MKEKIDPVTGEVTEVLEVITPSANPVWESFKALFTGGKRTMDSTPIELPVGYHQPLTLEEKMARIMRNDRLMRELDAQGFETFDEADDFDTGEDDDDFEYGNDFDAANIQAQQFGVVQHDSPRSVEAIHESIRLRKEAQATPLPSGETKRPQTAGEGEPEEPPTAAS